MSRSIRKDTNSLAPGSDGAFGADSAGLVVAALKAISAICRESVGCLAINGILARLGAICPAGMRSAAAQPSHETPNPTSSRRAVSYTHLRAHETRHDLVCR